MSKPSKEGLIKWSTKADAEVADGWAQFERKLHIKLQEDSRSHCILGTDPQYKVKKVPVKIAIEDIETLSNDAFNKRKFQFDQREKERNKIIADNKNVLSDYENALADVSSLFEGGSNPAQVIKRAIASVADKSWIKKYRAVMSALETEYKPSGVVDAMKLRKELSELKDSGKSFTDWHAQFQRLKTELEMLDEWPTVKEVDQLVILNVRNPGLMIQRNQLILDTNVVYEAGESRKFNYASFIREAAIICSTDTEVDNWGCSAKANWAGKVDKTKKRDSEGAIKRSGCWRCGGPHSKRECTSVKCTNCGVSLVNSDGEALAHDVSICKKAEKSGGGGKSFSKGGDGGKGKAAKAENKVSVSATKADSGGLPMDFKGVKAKQIRAMMVKAQAALDSRPTFVEPIAVSKKKSSKKSKKSKRAAEEEEDESEGDDDASN